MTGADLIAFAKKHTIGTICVLLVVACGVLLYFRWGALAASQAEYEAKSTEAAKMIANVKNAPSLEEQVAEIQQLSKELESRLIKPGQLAVNLQYFYKLEADNEVKLLDVRQNTPARRAGGKPVFMPVPFSLTVQGPYANVMKFLGGLQTGRHFCRILNSNLTRSGGASEGGSAPARQEYSLVLNVELLGQP
ncbi:MAG: hypothetical protein ACOZE5_02585 [Verrucomicrobiota bacterium]